MPRNVDRLTPAQIRARGRELLQIAAQKERELRKRQLLRIGEIFQREIAAGWPSTWEDLAAELESIMGKIDPPRWSVSAGVQGGGSAPLVTVIEDVKKEARELNHEYQGN